MRRTPDNVRRAITELGITYPAVHPDNDYKVWEAFNNSYWPADYPVNAKRPDSPSSIRRRRL